MSHSFGKSSMDQYDTLHVDLQLTLTHAIALCEVDFSLIEGYRSPIKQFDYYKKGRKLNEKGKWVIVNSKQVITNVDGYNILGSHNHYPSKAVDIAIYIEGKPQLAYDPAHLAYVAACVIRSADILYSEGKITHKVRWGGDWNRNGDFTDSKLIDKPHLELYKPE